MTAGSSKWPAGVSSIAPSGLNVNLRKKLVKFSSPYSLTEVQEEVPVWGRIAGKGGIGDGDRPKWPWLDGAGEAAAFEPLKEERLEEDLST